MKYHFSVYLRAFEEKTVKLPEFDLEFPEDEDHTTMLEAVFRMLNWVGPNDQKNAPTGGKHRSLSCGDLVCIEDMGIGGHIPCWYICSSMGWDNIHQSHVQHALNNPVMKGRP